MIEPVWLPTHGYFVSADDQIGQAEENEYVFMLRSHTSAYAYYYANAYTGYVYVAQETPVISVYEEREYIFHALGTETEASMTEKPEYTGLGFAIEVKNGIASVVKNSS